jgi:GNAT superfamily N-acetyltransferase
MLLGVDQARQRQGIGSALLAPTLERADLERLPCYLETLATMNVPFYERHGFAVVTSEV